jgi:hypothetical protein
MHARESLLHIGWLPQHIPDVLEAVPFSLTEMKVSIGTMVREVWQVGTFICKKCELSDGLVKVG